MSSLLLETLAQAVVDNWEKGDLAAAVTSLGKELEQIKNRRAQSAPMIAAARRLHASDDCEIDDEPMVSPGEAEGDGGWVNAWLWIHPEHFKDQNS